MSKNAWAVVGTAILSLAVSVPPPARAEATVSIELEGPIGPIRILRDPHGMPHVFAGNDHDAYFAMGFLHAADRFFQMDYSRRLFSGTLAELMGPSALDSDIELRTLGLRRAAEKSAEVYSPEALGILEAYVQGVNTWIAQPDSELPPEYSVLELSQPAPWTLLDSLTVIKGVAFGLSFDLGDIEREEDLQAFLDAGQQQGFDGRLLFMEDLFRSAPFDPSISIPGGLDTQQEIPQRLQTRKPEAMTAKVPTRVSRTLLSSYLDKVRRIPLLAGRLPRSNRSGGSNFWVVGPGLSASGHGLIANDPHLSLDAPAVFYEIHLSVERDPGRGSMNVTGVSFAGTPGVVQGCNERICWGSTVNPMDVTDVYRERLVLRFPLGIQGTLFEGEMEPVVAIPQVFRVNRIGNSVPDDLETADVGVLEGGVTYLVPRRNMGPIVAVEQDSQNPFDIQGLSVQYTGWGPTREGETFLLLGRARNLQDFREALQYFDFGSQNWGYADVDGNIAYFTSGELPLREDLQAELLDGAEPWFVRDGSHAALNEWTPAGIPEPLQATNSAILPFSEMPQVVNPSQGFIVNANNDPIGVSLDNNVLGTSRRGGGILYLNPGFTSLRIGRIDQMMQEAIAANPSGLGLADMERMQADNQLLDARVLVPYILEAFDRASLSPGQGPLVGLAQDAAVTEAVGRLRDWDFTTPTGIRNGYDPGDDPDALPDPSEEEIQNSVAATLYAVWRSRFVAGTIDAALERLGLDDHRPDSERSMSALRNLLERFPERLGRGASGVDFFHVESVADPEDARDYLILNALREALDRLSSGEYGEAFGGSANQLDYRWGRLHRIQFEHPLGEVFSIPVAGGFQHLEPGLPGLARPGGWEAVDASAHSVRGSGSYGFLFDSGPARRFVAELDPGGIRAYQVIPGGSSGRRDSSRYANGLGHWLTNQYRILNLAQDVIEQEKDSELVLRPLGYRFLLPYYRGGASHFTGFATANLESSRAALQFTGLDPDGTVSPYPRNPARFELEPGTQLALLGSEIFEVPAEQEQGSWVELSTGFETGPQSWPAVASFFQVGNLDGQVRGLDGGTAQHVPSRRIFLSRIYQWPAGDDRPAATTRVSLANPGDEPVQAALELFVPAEASPPGSGVEPRLAGTIHRDLPAGGFLFASVADLFGVQVEEGYVRVTAANGHGLVGFELIERREGFEFLALDALPVGGAHTSYSAQFAYGPLLDTEVKLINASPFDRRVLIRALRASGGAELVSPPIDLAAGGAVELRAGTLFPDLAPEGGYFVASVKIDSDGAGVIGDVTFGDFETRRYFAALPLQIAPFRSAVFGHLAELPGTLFTGLALFNPGSRDGEVTISVFSRAGVLIARESLTLAAGARVARTLGELLPGLGEVTGGYLRVDSTEPLIGQELFGNEELTLQSAVPPTILE